MDMRKYSGETFIKVDDVRNGPVRVQIAVVKEGKYDKANLVFESGEVLGLNSTNNRTLIRAYGPNSDDWIGKEIELYLGEIIDKHVNGYARLVSRNGCSGEPASIGKFEEVVTRLDRGISPGNIEAPRSKVETLQRLLATSRGRQQ